MHATTIDRSHDPARRSWVASANESGTDFPIQNLPWGVFRDDEGAARIGIAIGDQVLDAQAAVLDNHLPDLPGTISCALCAPTLNQFMGLGHDSWTAARHAIADASSAVDTCAIARQQLRTAHMHSRLSARSSSLAYRSDSFSLSRWPTATSTSAQSPRSLADRCSSAVWV